MNQNKIGDVEMGDFIAYEKEVTTVVEKTTHTIRIRLGASAADVVDLLKQVPPKAVIHEILECEEGRDFRCYGEIIFTEEKVRN